MTVVDRITLDGDDAEDMLRELERRLGFAFEPEEIDSALSLGELRDAIVGHIDPRWSEGRRCLDAMSFFRLRKALAAMGAPRASTVSALERVAPPLTLLAELKRRSGLDMPSAQPGAAALAGLGLAMGSIGVALAGWTLGVWHLSLAAACLLGPLGWMLYMIAPWRLPSGCETLGGLARRVAMLNVATLARDGARVGEAEIWRILVRELSDVSGVSAAAMSTATQLKAY